MSEKRVNESKFSIEEICSNSRKLFGVYPEVIHGALSNSKVKEFTLAEVEAAIKAFKEKEVH